MTIVEAKNAANPVFVNTQIAFNTKGGNTASDRDDDITGGDANDFLFGGGGEDFIWGGKGNDEIHGEAGHDELWGQGGKDTLLGGGGRDMLDGGSGNDILSGGSGDDVLKGGKGKGADELYGGSGNDILDGGKGKDILSGGEGNDILTGGGGRDTFLFDSIDSDDRDIITDFNVNREKIVFAGDFDIEDFTVVNSVADAIVKYNGKSVLLLQNVDHDLVLDRIEVDNGADVDPFDF